MIRVQCHVAFIYDREWFAQLNQVKFCSKLIKRTVCVESLTFSGVYIARDRKDVPEEFRGIGIRIEDDVLITSESTVEVLTKKCLKDPVLMTKQVSS